MMKNIWMGCLLLHCSILMTIYSLTGNAESLRYSVPGYKETSADSTRLPECVKKLNRPGNKGVRSYSGGQQFTSVYTLKSGKILYAFRNERSIGCYANEPAGSKYYDDSCKLAASFPAKFSIKQSFKPFIATGYIPADFTESMEGDYPLYFAKEKDKPANTIQNEEGIKDAYATEKWFTLGNVATPLLDFKKGDVIKIHTATGLWHYRNKKLLNQYKIVPQLAIITHKIVCARAPCPPIVTKKLVYFVGAAERFIDINYNSLLVSEEKQKDANTPTKPLETKWVKAFEIKSRPAN